MKKLLSSAAALLVMASAAAAWEPNYRDRGAWAAFGGAEARSADLFLIAPSVDVGRGGNDTIDLDDPKMAERFISAISAQRGIYEDSCAVYAPFYRQITLRAYRLPVGRRSELLAAAYRDVREAFLCFLEARHRERPFIIAGYSQGADMAKRLAAEFGTEPRVADALTAVYAIGWRLTETDLRVSPHIRPATGELDLGTMISFTAEAPDADDSMIIPKGVRSISINPLNWRTDSEPADASANLGARFFARDGSLLREVPHITGAYIDPVRGTLKCPDIDPDEWRSPHFPRGVYHLMDCQFFYEALKQNVAARTRAWYGTRRSN